MRKKTLTFVSVLLAYAIVLAFKYLGFSVPFGLSFIFAGLVLAPVLLIPLMVANKPLLAWRKARGRDIEDEERYEDEATGMISLRPRQ
jgi:hypothetical protein